METEPVEEQGPIGSYQLLSVVPDRFRTVLICVHDIVAAEHSVTFNQHNTIISDNGTAYTLRIHRDPTSREWRVPLTVTFRAPHPPTAAYPNRDAPQLTTGQHIQERPAKRTRTKHCYPRRSPPRPHRARTRRSAMPSHDHYLAQYGSDTVRHTTRLLSSTLPRLRSCQTQQGQQINLVKTTTSPTTATTHRQTLTCANHHQNRSLTGRNPTRTRGGHTLGYW